MRGRRVVGPEGPPLVSTAGRGGPVPVDPQKQKPINPPVQLPSIQWPSASGLTSVISQGVGEWVAAAQVGAGVVLLVVGLLLATGVLGGTARAGARVARTGARLLR